MAGLGVLPLVDICTWNVHFLLSPSPILLVFKQKTYLAFGNARMNIVFKFCDS